MGEVPDEYKDDPEMYWAIQDSLKMSFPTDDQPSTPKKSQNQDKIMSTVNINDQVNYTAPYEETFDFPDNNTPVININDKPVITSQFDDNMNKSMGISQTKTPSTAEYVSNTGNQSFDNLNNVSYDNDDRKEPHAIIQEGPPNGYESADRKRNNPQSILKDNQRES